MIEWNWKGPPSNHKPTFKGNKSLKKKKKLKANAFSFGVRTKDRDHYSLVLTPSGVMVKS